jgi:hypothetical protein
MVLISSSLPYLEESTMPAEQIPDTSPISPNYEPSGFGTGVAITHKTIERIIPLDSEVLLLGLELNVSGRGSILVFATFSIAMMDGPYIEVIPSVRVPINGPELVSRLLVPKISGGPVGYFVKGLAGRFDTIDYSSLIPVAEGGIYAINLMVSYLWPQFVNPKNLVIVNNRSLRAIYLSR